jgi:hypothetical protein
MEDQAQTVPQPPVQEAPATPAEPTKPAPPAPKRPILLWVLVALAVVVVWILASRSLTKFGFVTTEPTPATNPSEVTPTPELSPAPLATESAYMILEGSVASLSAQIRASVVTDATLNPPVIDLLLGFTLK